MQRERVGGVLYLRAPPPAGTTVVVIESDECCTKEPLTGRQFDRSLSKPSFYQKSEGEWQAFLSKMERLVKSYRKEAVGMYLIPVVVLVFILFHPSFGPVRRSLRGRSYTRIRERQCDWSATQRAPAPSPDRYRRQWKTTRVG